MNKLLNIHNMLIENDKKHNLIANILTQKYKINRYI